MTDEEEKTGLMSDPEQDRAILDLTAELRITNKELQHTNESIKNLVICIKEQSDEIEEVRKEVRNIKEKELLKIHKVLAKHGVWIGLVAAFANGLIAILAGKVFGGGK